MDNFVDIFHSIGTAGVLLILGLGWRAYKGLQREIKSEIKSVVDPLRTEIRLRFDSVDERLDTIDRRFDAVDKRFDAIENRLGRIEQNHLDHIVTLHVNRSEKKKN